MLAMQIEYSHILQPVRRLQTYTYHKMVIQQIFFSKCKPIKDSSRFHFATFIHKIYLNLNSGKMLSVRGDY